jgi:hypothetical protein
MAPRLKPLPPNHPTLAMMLAGTPAQSSDAQSSTPDVLAEPPKTDTKQVSEAKRRRPGFVQLNLRGEPVGVNWLRQSLREHEEFMDAPTPEDDNSTVRVETPDGSFVPLWKFKKDRRDVGLD